MNAVLPGLWIVLVAVAPGPTPGWAETSSERFEFRLPQREHYAVAAREPTVNAAPVRPQWLAARLRGSTNAPVELGSRVVLQLRSPRDRQRLVAGSDLILVRTVNANTFILQAPDARTAARQAQRLAALPEVTACYPVMRRPTQLNGPYAPKPTDLFYDYLWTLERRDATGAATGMDLNVRAAWPFTRGEGVTIAVADTGVELSHQELVSRVEGAPHFNFSSRTTNGLPFGTTASWAHGTEVAGLAVAELNQERVAGVAPGARLASWVIFETNLAGLIRVSDEALMDMYQYRSNEVAVQSLSWNDPGTALGGPTLLENIGLSNALTHGRAGRGVIMVRAAGNDRDLGANANDDGYANDPRVIAVAAARFDGRTATYSEPGACVLVAAPSGDEGFNGLITTDLKGTSGVNQINFFPPNQDLSDYVFNQLGFSGTSAAVPQIAGVAALLLAVNPTLSLRDVQQILLLSARHFDLADPDLRRNGAGLWISHNDGFGVPDAGEAVQLARGWPNRPAVTSVTVSATEPAAIPDDGLRVIVSGDHVPASLLSLQTLPGTGPHADEPTPALPLVYVGLATNPIAQNLTNQGALIQRGTNNYEEKIRYAAAAGAAFALVYNFATNSGSGAPGGDQLTPMGRTDYVPIPAVFLGHSDGEALRMLFETNTAARARIQLEATNLTFTVTNTLLLEHVALRVRTDHPVRGDLRITLVSPSGTRSVLQRYNGDLSAGPEDWTYTSAQHFYECAAGTWTAWFADEFAGGTGQVLGADLTLYGVPQSDGDGDGLDDAWETNHFGDLRQGSNDDVDRDGYANIREQVMGTDPNLMDVPFQLDLSPWNSSLARLSWPGSSNFTYEVWSGTNVAALLLETNVPGQFPVTEWFTSYTHLARQFFRVRARLVE